MLLGHLRAAPARGGGSDTMAAKKPTSGVACRLSTCAIHGCTMAIQIWRVAVDLPQATRAGSDGGCARAMHLSLW